MYLLPQTNAQILRVAQDDIAGEYRNQRSAKYDSLYPK
jgi:hypothetical protein